jgi:nitroimidazol reductase NimA-like FMN-containing flavoprotein (pyridoxamine 5'-phosphate oxidase superfamily)
MPRDYLNKPFNELRRKNRGKDDAWINGFLRHAPVGAMAIAVEGQSFINNHLIVDERRTLVNLVRNNRVCFSVTAMGRLLPADEAVEVSLEFGDVVIFGCVSIVENETEAKHALQRLMDKYLPHLKPEKDYCPTDANDLKITAVLRIDIESSSGKEKKAADYFPRAFYFGDRGNLEPLMGNALSASGSLIARYASLITF